MKRRKHKTGNVKLFIVAGFLTLYLIGMLLTTYLTKEQYHNLARTSASHVTRDMLAEIEDIQLLYNSDGSLSNYCLDYMQYILTKNVEILQEHTMVSAGLLDADGNLLAQSADCYYQFQPRYVNGEPEFTLIDFSAYFTEAEISTFRQYYTVETQKSWPALEKGYGASLAYDTEHNELVHFYIKESQEHETENGSVTEVFQDTIFSYLNPDYHDIDYQYASYETSLDAYMSIPYLQYGEECYTIWKNDPHLHNYFTGVKEDQLTGAYTNRDYGTYEGTYLNRIYLGNNSEKDYSNPDYILITNFKVFPWQAAITQLTGTYFYSACFVVICMLLVLYLTDQTYKKQAQLEQIRRDFTNAVAHELKTPLSIVRGLAETMEETDSEEKKSRYRAEIVNQTEIMDNLVKEMIFISKIDSDQMVLNKEPVSIRALLEKQVSHLLPLMQEKNLQFQFQSDGDFMVEGDQSYLEKAIFNLIENAVSHNKQDGSIRIHVAKNRCTIENTATPIPEEALSHVFDMFYTTSQSRTHSDTHRGLGLYLTKRILNLHGIHIDIENTDLGIKVTIHIRK